MINIDSNLSIVNNILYKCLVIRCDYTFNGHSNRLFLYIGSHYVFLSIGDSCSYLKGKISDSNLNSYFSFLNDVKESTSILDYSLVCDYLNLIVNRVLKVYSSCCKTGFKLKLDKKDDLRFSRLVNRFSSDKCVLSNLNLGFTVRSFNNGEKALFVRNGNLGLKGDIYVIHPTFIYNLSSKSYLYMRKDDNNYIKDYLFHLLSSYKSGLLSDLESVQFNYLYSSIKSSYRLNGLFNSII